MLGDISPQTVRITQQAVVYPSRDHVTSLRVERFDGRTYKPVDMTAVTRVILSFPEADPVIVYDSAVQAVFTHVGTTLTVDLSDYAMPVSVLGCQIILYDAEHPAGQVLVDDIDAVVQFDFRNVSPVGGIPAPAVDYLTDAPIDGVPYARKDGVWVPVDALVSGVSSVNGQSGVVVLTAADVGADATGTGASAAAAAVAAHTALADPHPQYLTHAEGNAAYDASGAATSAVSAHVADSDPHPQYTTQSEGDARYERGLTAGANITIDRTNPVAPVISASGGGGGGAVDSVNGQTGVVVLDAADVGADAAGTAAAAVAAHVAATNPHPEYLTQAEGDTAYAPIAHVGDGGAAHSNAVAAGAAGFMTGADKTKLDGIAAGATQNSADATLLARANHTGTQTASTISDFASASRAQTEAELVAGTNVTITPSGSGATRQLTIAAAGGGTGMANPMTTAGDMIYGGAAGVPARLPVGATGKVLGVASGTPAWVDPPAGGTSQGPNLVINSAFQVNQLNQSATSGTVTLAAGEYGWQSSTDKGFDQWKGGSSGCTYTFSTTANVTTITITAGSLQQVIEGKNLQSGTHALSWSGTAQGKIGAGSYSGSGITGPATGGTNLTIEFNAGTLLNVKFEQGSTPTAHDLPTFSKTLSDCRRYLPAFVAIGTGVQFVATAYAFSTSQISVGYQFDVFPMVPPTGVALSSAAHFNVNAAGGGAGPATAVAFSSASSKAGRLLATATGAITLGGGAEFFALGTSGAWLVFTGCEL